MHPCESTCIKMKRFALMILLSCLATLSVGYPQGPLEEGSDQDNEGLKCAAYLYFVH